MKKLILESILLFLIGMYATNKLIACYDQLYRPPSLVLVDKKITSTNISQSPESNFPLSDIKGKQECYFYIYLKKEGSDLQYQIFSEVEFVKLEKLSKNIGKENTEKLMEYSVVIDKNEFMKIVDVALKEPILFANNMNKILTNYEKEF